MSFSLILSCEHAGQKIFCETKQLKLPKYLSETHRAYDLGAYLLACKIKSKTRAPLFAYEYTRLVLDSNRSLFHSDLWGPLGKDLAPEYKNMLLKNYYIPFRQQTKNCILRSPKPVLHLSVHSMANELNSKTRDCDVSLLYDPSRASEKLFCNELKNVFELFGLKCRLNYPYQGISDGHCTSLRKLFSGEEYLGIEFELNQKHIQKTDLISDILVFGFKTIINQ